MRSALRSTRRVRIALSWHSRSRGNIRGNIQIAQGRRGCLMARRSRLADTGFEGAGDEVGVAAWRPAAFAGEAQEDAFVGGQGVMVSAACCSLMSGGEGAAAFELGGERAKVRPRAACAWSRYSASSGSAAAADSPSAMMAAVRVINAAFSAANRAKTSSTGPCTSARHSARSESGVGASSPWTATWMTCRSSVALVVEGEVHRLLGDSGLRRDGLHARARVAVAQEQRLRGRQDRSASRGSPLIALRRRVAPARPRRLRWLGGLP